MPAKTDHGAFWTKEQFNEQLGLVREYAQNNPAGFNVELGQWEQPKHRQRRVVVEGVRDAFTSLGLTLERNWRPTCFERASLMLHSDKDLGFSFVALSTDMDTYIGQARVNRDQDHFSAVFGSMIALYRASYRYGQENARRCLKIIENARPLAGAGKTIQSSYVDVGILDEMPISESAKERLREWGIAEGGVVKCGQPADAVASASAIIANRRDPDGKFRHEG